MGCLPLHGRVQCTRCFQCANPSFDQTRVEDNSWRITWNPLAWGNSRPEIVVLGFSKGPTQAGALATTPHDEIAFKKGRTNVGKILNHIGLLESAAGVPLSERVDQLISDTEGRFHFASLIRCSVERFDSMSNEWKGTGGGVLDKFVATEFGRRVAENCGAAFLSSLPEQTKLVVMFGLGTDLNYVQEAFNVFASARPGNWRWINQVAYSDSKIAVVHVEHFASQGANIPNWLGQNDHPRSALGNLAREAVGKVFS